MNPTTQGLGRFVLCGALLGLAANVAQAQLAADPMRPPDSLLSNNPPGDARSGGRQLQSVMILPNERWAIIGGERVKLGGRVGDARVVSISESEVILRSAAGSETLRLYPQVDMKPAKSPVSANSKSPANSKVPAKSNAAAKTAITNKK